MFNRGFAHPLTGEMLHVLQERALASRGSVLTATSVANSGHPGGSFSSMELYTVLFGCARINPELPRWPERDRIVVSHGHTSPGVYTALAAAGFFDIAEVEAHTRQAGSLFEGHVERQVPGVEWSTGNLGQGLSAGLGMALAARSTGRGWHTFVAMSDGEQHKGQVSEARRLAVKEGIADLTVVADINGIQISGKTADIMPVNIAEGYRADGWRVIEVDGHDMEAVYGAIAEAVADTSAPVAVLARTHMGWPVSFMLDDEDFHGRGLKPEEYERAMEEMGLEPRLEEARARRSDPVKVEALPHEAEPLTVSTGTPRNYAASDTTDNRSAWGAALLDIAEADTELPMLVLDCDLAVSVKTDAFAERFPDRFVQCGVGEHNAAAVAGGASVNGVLTFWADFGVFGCDEVYNQQRLNDINGAAVKLALTHCGVDVGEDGRTHHCIDYAGTFRNMFGWKVIVPADPNQTDRAARWMAASDGSAVLAMGRSKLATVTDRDGVPVFGEGYEFEYGRMTRLREGQAACILVMGTLTGAAVKAADILTAEGYDVAVECVSAPLALDDEGMERALAAPLIVTVEDHHIRSGLGNSVAEWLGLNGRATRLARIGHDGFRSSGSSGDLFEQLGMSAERIAETVRELL